MDSTTIGKALTKTLDDLVDEDKITMDTALEVLAQFDRSMFRAFQQVCSFF